MICHDCRALDAPAIESSVATPKMSTSNTQSPCSGYVAVTVPTRAAAWLPTSMATPQMTTATKVTLSENDERIDTVRPKRKVSGGSVTFFEMTTNATIAS